MLPEASTMKTMSAPVRWRSFLSRTSSFFEQYPVGRLPLGEQLLAAGRLVRCGLAQRGFDGDAPPRGFARHGADVPPGLKVVALGAFPVAPQPRLFGKKSRSRRRGPLLRRRKPAPGLRVLPAVRAVPARLPSFPRAEEEVVVVVRVRFRDAVWRVAAGRKTRPSGSRLH